MKILVSVEYLDKIIDKMGQRVNPNVYFVCRDLKGNVVFVPTKTSRHTHTIVVVTPSEKDVAKVEEWIRVKGFELIDGCIAMPDSS